MTYPHSDRCPRFSRDFAYWLAAPLEAIASGDWRVVSVLGGTGSGKSTLLETLVAYIVALDPGPTQIIGATDEDISDFAEVRLMPMLRTIPATAALMPVSRHAIRKAEIIFPHMPMYLSGANLASLQAKSTRWMLLDECWCMRRSMMSEAFARLHDRPNSLLLALGQAGLIGDEHDLLNETCRLNEFGWVCPQCSGWNLYNFRAGIKFDDSRNERGIWDWEAVVNSVRMVCPRCQASFADTETNRRMLSKSGSYRAQPGNPLPGRIAFHYPALCVWWIEWSRITLEFLQANQAKKTADYSVLRVWIQKRLAQPWNDADELPEIFFQSGGYSQADYEDGRAIENEAYRFLCIDVQKDHFWCVCRAWRNDGSSMLLYASRLLEWGQIVTLAEKYHLDSRFVLIDCGYNTTEVHRFCAAHRYTAMRGADETEWVHRDNWGKKRKRYFSPVLHVSTGDKTACVINWSNDRIKDILGLLRGRQGPAFEIPNDVISDYQSHMVSEIRKDVVDKNGDIRQRWVKIGSRAQHLFDCEALAVCGAVMMSLLPVAAQEERGETRSEKSSGSSLSA